MIGSGLCLSVVPKIVRLLAERIEEGAREQPVYQITGSTAIQERAQVGSKNN